MAAVVLVMTVLRRKDFGRRRALGASRGYIVRLLLTQVALQALAGITLGSGGAIIWLAATSTPRPGWPYLLAIATIALLAALLAATIPAILASRRSPLHELRTP